METSFNEKLKKAFKTLRKEKLFARMNFWCCQGCALSALSQDHPKEAIGYVFYHKQDGDNKKDGKSFYLAFGSFKENPTDKDGIEIGKKVVKCLEENGIDIEWNGMENIQQEF